MFIGHFGVGLAGKKVDSKISLGTLFLAAQWLDLVWPVFILLGLEKVEIAPGMTASNPLDFIYYPFSHSLFFVIIWALIFGFVYYFFKKNIKSAILLGGLVLSHWILDWIVHVPDLPILPWGNLKVGLGLWDYPVIAVIIELAIFFSGVYFYLSVTKSKNKKGTFGFWGLITFFVVVYVMNLFGPPPPSVEAIGYAGLLQWLFIPLAYWIDRNRMFTRSELSTATESKS